MTWRDLRYGGPRYAWERFPPRFTLLTVRAWLPPLRRPPQLVLWGARACDWQLGSAQDRVHCWRLDRAAAQLRAMRRLTAVCQVQIGPMMKALAEFGRRANEAMVAAGTLMARHQEEQAKRMRPLLAALGKIQAQREESVLKAASTLGAAVREGRLTPPGGV